MSDTKLSERMAAKLPSVHLCAVDKDWAFARETMLAWLKELRALEQRLAVEQEANEGLREKMAHLSAMVGGEEPTFRYVEVGIRDLKERLAAAEAQVAAAQNLHDYWMRTGAAPWVFNMARELKAALSAAIQQVKP